VWEEVSSWTAPRLLCMYGAIDQRPGPGKDVQKGQTQVKGRRTRHNRDGTQLTHVSISKCYADFQSIDEPN
jgi:hypothetical protein